MTRPHRRPARRLPLLAMVALTAASACERAAPGEPTASPEPRIGRIPADYVLIGPRGATAFPAPPRDGRADTGGRGAPRELLPGFGFAVTERRTSGDRRHVRLGSTGWVAADDVVPARPSPLAGVPVPHGGALDAAWVIAPEAVVRATPDPAARAIIARRRHTRVTLTGACRDGWCPLAVGWMRSSDLARPTIVARPPGIGVGDRWIDIDLGTQTLVAYRGDRPVFETLVSTGIGVGDSPFATPIGTFAIRSKAELVRMDNLEHTGVVPYSYDVPLAQYFSDGKALHAALWHDRFGTPTSHGCVNLSPQDAEWLFDFTEATTGPARRGTPVHVHGQRPAVAAR